MFKNWDKEKRKAAAGSVIVHSLLIIALIFLALRTPLPLPGEEGVEVNLGYDDNGFGEIQKETPPPAEAPAVQQAVQPQPVVEEEIVKEEIIEQEIEDAPVLDSGPEEAKPDKITETEKPEEDASPKEVEEEVTEEKVKDSVYFDQEIAEEVTEEITTEPVVNQKALYKSNNKNNEGGSQGVTQGTGDQGKPHGSKDSERYDGRGGQGNGPSFWLGGRGSVHLETPSTKVTEQGAVVISIWVDRDGIVKKAQVNPKGTTVLDSRLRQIAIDAAYNSTFTKDLKATELQRGTITYNFIIMK